MPKSEVSIPEREPDITEDDYVSPVQNLLYRLTGDTNLIHADPDFVKENGFDKPFMQGLCSFGFAARMLIGNLFPGERERMKRMAAQMSSVLYPGTEIRLEARKMAEGKAYFRLVNKETGKPVLNRGVIEWQ